MEPKNRRVWELVERLQAEIAQEIRVLLNEEKYDPRIFTEAEQQRRIDALLECAADPNQTAAERHEAWCQMHRDNGWVYGPELKPADKQHPNLMPWNCLPASARSKANIFAICAKYAAELDALIPAKDA